MSDNLIWQQVLADKEYVLQYDKFSLNKTLKNYIRLKKILNDMTESGRIRYMKAKTNVNKAFVFESNSNFEHILNERNKRLGFLLNLKQYKKDLIENNENDIADGVSEIIADAEKLYLEIGLKENKLVINGNLKDEAEDLISKGNQIYNFSKKIKSVVEKHRSQYVLK